MHRIGKLLGPIVVALTHTPGSELSRSGQATYSSASVVVGVGGAGEGWRFRIRYEARGRFSGCSSAPKLYTLRMVNRLRVSAVKNKTNSVKFSFADTTFNWEMNMTGFHTKPNHSQSIIK